MEAAMNLNEKLKFQLPEVLSPMFYMALGAVLLISGINGMTAIQALHRGFKERATELSYYGLTNEPKKHLDSRFKDEDRDLLADPPTADKCVEPATLHLATIGSADGPNPFDIDEIGRAIAAATGKKVETSTFTNLKDELPRITAGTADIVIVRGAETPYMVNTFGFIPFAVARDDRGPIGHRMDIVVNAKSPIKAISEIRGHPLLCSLPLSIVGCRAAVAYLHEKENMNPDGDFQVVYSGSMKQSCVDIDSGKREIAALSNDKLHTLCENGTISPSHYRVLYESEVMPRFTIGYFYNLSPVVAQQVKAATLAFVGSPTDADINPPVDGSVRFVPINYAKDFVTLRQIDDAFDARMTAKINSVTGAMAKKGDE